jgi:hypothetical protein
MPNPDLTQPESVEGDEDSGTDALREPAPESLRDAEDTRGDEAEGQFAVPVRPAEESQDGNAGF